MSDVLSEHLSYVSLSGRASLFERAIASTLKEGDVVADLGCGVAVLGLQCLKAGAARVYGIDRSQAIHIAREMAERSGLQDRYLCVSGSTSEVELPERVDMLICDHIGFFGFDYGIVEMLRDAAERFLKPGGKIIPDRLNLTVAGVHSDECRQLVTGWTEADVPVQLHWIADKAANTRHSRSLDASDLCTGPAKLGHIELGSEGPDLYSFTGEIVAERKVRFDGLAGWFDAHLGGDVWMTNSPLSNQSIGRPQAFLPVTDPFDVQAGDRIGIKLRARYEGDLIVWSVQPPNGLPQQEMSTWASMALTPDDLSCLPDAPVSPSARGLAAKRILALLDGTRTAVDIEQIIGREFPEVFPTAAATRQFVRRSLARYIEK